MSKIDTEHGPKSLLWNSREIELEDVVRDARRCWGSTTVRPTNDPVIKQERMIHQMISNWVRNSLVVSEYN